MGLLRKFSENLKNSGEKDDKTPPQSKSDDMGRKIIELSDIDYSMIKSETLYFRKNSR